MAYLARPIDLTINAKLKPSDSENFQNALGLHISTLVHVHVFIGHYIIGCGQWVWLTSSALALR